MALTLEERAREWREQEMGEICDKGYFTIANVDFDLNLTLFARTVLEEAAQIADKYKNRHDRVVENNPECDFRWQQGGSSTAETIAAAIRQLAGK